MGSEYFINSQELEDKVRNLLPSQGGAGAGFDLSASTQIIPIIDLTESAEGSNLRQDLQSSISFDSATVFNVNNTTTTVITNTGYWRIIGGCVLDGTGTPTQNGQIILNDGTSDKVVWGYEEPASVTGVQNYSTNVDYTVFLPAGHSLKISATSNARFRGSVRQIADIAGQLVNP